MTEQVYLTRERIDELRTAAVKAIEFAEGESKLIRFDVDKIAEVPKISKKNNSTYKNYRCEVFEIVGDEEIERALEVTEFQVGKILEKLNGASGILKVTGVKNSQGFINRKYETI